jgi:Fe-S-cluster-containing hydrogenase component 2
MSDGTARMATLLEIDDVACRVCRRCLASEVCRANAFVRFDRDEPPFIDTSKCWGCMLCVPACPFGAVVVHTYDNSES